MRKRVLSILLTAMMVVQGVVPALAEIEGLDEIVIEESVEEVSESENETMSEEIISENTGIILDESEELDIEEEQEIEEGFGIEEETVFTEEDLFLQEELSDESDLVVSENNIVEEVETEPENSEDALFEAEIDSLEETSPHEEEIQDGPSSGDIELVGKVVDSGTCGDNLIWILTDDGVLRISGKGEIKGHYYNLGEEDGYMEMVEYPWDEMSDSVKSVIIESGVTSIGEFAFSRCEKLTDVTIPDSVTSIGEWALYSENLKNIKVSNGNSAYSSLDGVLFSKNRTELILCPRGKTGSYKIPDSVTSILNEAFFLCKNLTNVTFGNSVVSVGEDAFNQCTHLKSVTISNSVKSIGEAAFSQCDSLSSVTLGNSMTSIGEYAFSACVGLKSLIIPNSVTSIGDCAFDCCNYLENVTLSNRVTRIGIFTFSNCWNLKSITIPDSVISIGSYAFDECSGLNSIKFEGNAPQFEENVFDDVNATAYYPKGNSTWTSSIMQDYGGIITWKAYTLTLTATVFPTELKLDLGETGKITVSGLNSSDRVVLWEIGNAKVATVNNGTVKAVGSGSTTIRITTLKGLKKYVKVTVHPPKQPKLIAAYNGAKGIGIKFFSVDYAEEYVIYQKYNGKWNSIRTISVKSSELQAEGNKLMYTDASVVKNYGKGYIYSVAAKNGTVASTYDKTGKAIYRLKPPALASAINSVAGTATVTWKGVFDKTETNGNYDLQYAEFKNSKAGEFKSVTKLPGYNNLTFKTDVKGLKKGTAYVFRIRCSKTNKDRGTFYSEYSPWKTLKVTK